MTTFNTISAEEAVAEVPEFYSGFIRWDRTTGLFYLRRKDDDEVLAVCKTYEAAEAAARLLLSK